MSSSFDFNLGYIESTLAILKSSSARARISGLSNREKDIKFFQCFANDLWHESDSLDALQKTIEFHASKYPELLAQWRMVFCLNDIQYQHNALPVATVSFRQGCVKWVVGMG